MTDCEHGFVSLLLQIQRLAFVPAHNGGHSSPVGNCAQRAAPLYVRDAVLYRLSSFVTRDCTQNKPSVQRFMSVNLPVLLLQTFRIDHSSSENFFSAERMSYDRSVDLDPHARSNTSRHSYAIDLPSTPR